MNAVAFDSLKYSRLLQENGGFSQKQAEAAAGALTAVLVGDLVTKTDLELVETRLKSEIRQEAAVVTAKIGRVEALHGWMIGFVLVLQTGILIKLLV